jgi:uncharacterized membrane protein
MTATTNGLLGLLFGGIGFISLLAVLTSIGNPGWPVNATTLLPIPLWAAALVAIVSLLIAACFLTRFKRQRQSGDLDA